MTGDRVRNVVIGGEAGQGLVTAGQVLARALVRSGYAIVVTQSYQSRIRGGHNSFAVRLSREAIAAPQESIDLLIALDTDTITRHRAQLVAQGVILAASDEGQSAASVVAGPTRPAAAADVALSPAGPRLTLPITRFGGRQTANLAVLGVAAALLGIRAEEVAAAAAAFLRRHPESASEAEQAIRDAFVWAQQQERFGDASAVLRLPPTGDTPAAQRVMLNGNQAIALGAISAGARFCTFYPMTPATSIPLTLVSLAESMGLVVEQAEDEIAAINMAIGASFAGAPALVATSGGGFALMAEGVSLAAMTETPLVIVVAQRPGPATGLPTRTEQADLEFVLHAGHGEFPRAIFAPSTVESCFALTRRAFDLAERFQSPVFILTDQFLADSLRAVEPFAVQGLPAVDPGAGVAPSRAAGPTADGRHGEAPYRRHALTDSGVTPRLVPGRSTQLVVTDSDEHTEDGHLTEDLAVRRRMVDKRLRKERGIRAEVLAPVRDGDGDPELLLVSWGSTGGAVREAANELQTSGRRVATLHFSQVWPLEPDQFLAQLRAAGAVVAVEGNATGQLARLIRRECGFEIPRRVQRYDGLPITPEYILRSLGARD